MGFCPCFGRRKKGLRSKNEQHNDDQNPSSCDKSSVEMNSRLEPNSSVSKDNDRAKNSATIFSFRELATATNNFRGESRIGEGGFGAVYKGTLETTGQTVAVKQLNHSGVQGDKEFLVEVLMLSLLRHPNLVNLIGYCAEGDQRLLVYEYMPLGSLEDHLHDLKPDMEPLDWNVRMQIAAGAAQGLNFLHNEADPPVIYRDLKTSNILLDEGFNPKLSDFGFAKFGPSDDKSHVSTRVMGTHGYCAPEYACTGKLTMKSDIYSFGVVLLELITGRRALIGKRKHILVDWARPMLKDRRKFVNLADPLLKGRFSEASLNRAIAVAALCLKEDAKLRPSMKDVVYALNYLASRGPEEQSNENSEQIRLLGRDRERAVAEAKRWGESWRDKRRGSTQNDGDDL